MNYYKNAEVTKLYHVSLSAVSHWIDAGRRKRNDLELVEDGGKFFIADTEKNRIIMSEIVQQGKKFINSRSRKIVHPKPEFYKLFTQEQIFDIIRNIEAYREVPTMYTYFDSGADKWDQYTHYLRDQNVPSLITSTLELIDVNMGYITKLLHQRKRVNVIDLGVGNGLPVKNILEHLFNLGVLNRYIPIDASQRMLDITESNVKKWFGGRVRVEHHVRNIVADRFDNLVVADSFDDTDSVNLVLFFGGTLSNMRAPDDVLRVINNSMQAHDVLIYSNKLDTPTSRRYFDFDFSRHRMVLDLLNIDESLYEIERVYDESLKARFIRARLNVTISIPVKFGERTRTINLDKGDALLLWRFWHVTARDEVNRFYNNGFNLLQTSQTEDHNYILAIADIKPTELGSQR